MKRVDIDRMFAEIVSRYISDGCVINTQTMAGHQGEVAKVDLRKGEDVFRVVLVSGHTWDGDYDWYLLRVGKATEAIRKEDSTIMWTDNLETVEETKIFQIGRDWYTVDEAEAKECAKVKMSRLYERYEKIDVLSRRARTYSKKARKIVLERVRKCAGCSSVKLWDIKSVRKVTYTDYSEFLVDVRNKVVKIGQIGLGA